MAMPTIEQINKARTDARTFADGTPYALDFTVNGESYTFIPNNVVKNGGVTAGENTLATEFLERNSNATNSSKKVNKGKSALGYIDNMSKRQ